MGESWYSDGLHFTCTQCGRCCSAFGRGGRIWVTDTEIRKLAAVLGIPPATFEREQVERLPDGRKSLRTRDKACVLLVAGRCSAYDARPLQCRAWPWWDSNLWTSLSWLRACHQCPGCGWGRLHTAAEIEERLIDVSA